MAQETAPAFLFFVQDFLTDANSARMTYEARGVYVTLLAHEWLEGALPVAPAALAALLHVTPARWKILWAQLHTCFVEDGDRLVNLRLERERRRQRAREQQRRLEEQRRAASARIGARARWGKAGAWLLPGCVCIASAML